MDDVTLDVAEKVVEPNSAATVKPKCCIHIVSEQSFDSDVKEFNESTLKKYRTVLAARRKFNMSDKNFNLPVSLNNYDCYHTQCYRKFTAVKKQKLVEISEADIKSLCYPEEINSNETDILAPTAIPKKNSSRQKKIVQNQTTDVLSIPDDSDYGYVMGKDIKYPLGLHGKHNELSFLAKNICLPD
ncbi:unnamed protein product [Ceutorhynchus assimilis]|uniref:Uncharacterized protein n=1 Tax=Ceutorhynchus assimilis TaxID=467358 RepID=A0A9N9MLG7_9CUCU|nr:unnamed protein product [Ceutorhynchus assimilis]